MSNFEFSLRESQTEADIQAELIFKLVDKEGTILSVESFENLHCAIRFMKITHGYIEQTNIPNNSGTAKLIPVNQASKILLNGYWLRLLYTRRLREDFIDEVEDDFF